MLADPVGCLGDQFLAAGEVPVYGADRDSGGSRDVGHCDLWRIFSVELFGHRPQDQFPGEVLVLVAKGARPVLGLTAGRLGRR